MRVKTTLGIIGLLFSVQAGAVSLPNNFSAGDPANAAEVNANFQALADAVNSAGSTQFGSAYSISPSSTGDLGGRNVIVLHENRGGSGGCAEDVYRVRVNYTNTNNDSVGNASGSSQPDEIWIYGFVCASGTTVNEAYEYVYAIPSSGGFDQAQGAEINTDADGDGTFESESSYDYRQTFNSNPLASAELVNSTEIYRDSAGELASAQSYASVASSLNEPLTVTGETFNDVIVQNFLSYDRTRFRANGIGVVQEVSDTGNFLSDPVFGGQVISSAIYYRIDGTANGDLSGTPFAAGEIYNSIWFQ